MLIELIAKLGTTENLWYRTEIKKTFLKLCSTINAQCVLLEKKKNQANVFMNSFCESDFSKNMLMDLFVCLLLVY